MSQRKLKTFFCESHTLLSESTKIEDIFFYFKMKIRLLITWSQSIDYALYRDTRKNEVTISDELQ